MDITTATPVEIDTMIAEAMIGKAKAEADLEAALTTIKRISEAQGTYEAYYPRNSQEKNEQAAAAARLAEVKIKGFTSTIERGEAEYARRGGWNRFYLVTNSGGHIHHTTGCDTCFPTTQFAWLTDQSGMDYADLVEMAGEKACAVCFPNLPVEILYRKSKIETPEAKVRREEREAKAAAKAASEIVVDNYFDHSRTPCTKTFKSTRAVTNAIAGNLSSLVCWGVDHPSAQHWLSDIKSLRDALAAKGIDYDYDKALTAARKRFAREGGTPKF